MNIKNIRLITFISIAAIFSLLASSTYYNKVKIPKLLDSKTTELRLLYDQTSWSTKIVIVPKVERIPAYTVFTTENMSEYFTEEIVPEKFLTGFEVSNYSDLQNKFSRNELFLNQSIMSSWLSSEDDKLLDSDREVEVRVRYLVGDTVKIGNLVDVSVNYDDGTADVVLSKVKIKDVKSPYTEIVSNEDGSTSVVNNSNPANREDAKDFIIILELDDNERELARLASKLGILDTQKYIDESQPSTPITFSKNVFEHRAFGAELSNEFPEVNFNGEVENVSTSEDSQESVSNPKTNNNKIEASD